MASQIKQSIGKNCSQNGDQEVIEALIADQISSSKSITDSVHSAEANSQESMDSNIPHPQNAAKQLSKQPFQ